VGQTDSGPSPLRGSAGANRPATETREETLTHHVRVRYDELRRAYEQGSHEARYFLDVQTGEIIPVFVDIVERGGNPDDVKRIASGVNVRYFLIPHKPSQEGYAEMESFIEGVKEKHLREQLLEAIEGKGAFRRFRDVLAGYPAMEERWIELKNERAREEIEAWLRENDIGIGEGE